MEHFQASPKQLKKLFEHTHLALRLYYRKEKWPAIYPTLTQLAERFVLLYRQAPNALHAHLQFYAADHGYTTNLVINQSILICALCHANGYSDEFTEELVLACLSDHICSTNETNRLARGKTLTPQEQKLLRLRHQIAIKMLRSANVPNGQLQRILARLDKYTSAITGAKHIPLYDNTTVLVCLAKRIAKAITPRPKVRAFSIMQAIKSLYLTTHNFFAQTSLEALAKQFNHCPSGAMVVYKEKNAIILLKSSQELTLALIDNSVVKGIIKTTKPLTPFYKPIVTTDKTLLYSIWFNELVTYPDSSKQGSHEILKVIAQLGKEQYIEFNAIEKAIAPYTQLELALQQAARQYNRQGQKATTLRHCLTMVGLDTAGLLCQRVLLEIMLTEKPHPFSTDIWCKYNLISKVTFVLISRNNPEAFESFLGPFTAAIYFILINHDSEVKRLVSICSDKFSQSPISLAQIFGFQTLDSLALQSFIEQYFKYALMHNAYVESELESKQSLSLEAKHFAVIKLVTMIILTGDHELTAWQNQLLENSLSEFGWDCRETLFTEILMQGPYCTIE